MWFTNSVSNTSSDYKINSVVWNVSSKFLSKGYQETIINFSVNSTGNSSLVIPIPWAPHKPNGGITIVNTNCENVQIFDIIKKLRELSLNVMFIEDIKYAYINDDLDCGYIFIPEIVSDTQYTLKINFKIGPNFCLYAPMKMSNILFQHRTPIESTVTVEGVSVARGYNTKILEKTSTSTEGPHTYKFKMSPVDNEDAFFPVNNWDSSDEE